MRTVVDKGNSSQGGDAKPGSLVDRARIDHGRRNRRQIWRSKAVRNLPRIRNVLGRLSVLTAVGVFASCDVAAATCPTQSTSKPFSQ
jgi:hypothetical protein